MFDRVPCPVVFESDALRFGEFANAFRVMADASGETVLDFCVYSAADNIAKVVARVRVARSFVALLDTRIGEAIAEFEALAKNSFRVDDEGVLVFPDGTRLLVGSNSGEFH